MSHQGKNSRLFDLNYSKKENPTALQEKIEIKFFFKRNHDISREISREI